MTTYDQNIQRAQLYKKSAKCKSRPNEIPFHNYGLIKMKKSDNTKCCSQCELIDLFYITSGNTNWYNYLGKMFSLTL